MPRRLPYQLRTETGNRFDFDFPLHPDTVSPVHVSQLLGALLGTLDREIRLQGGVGNGDLLQAMAMALAARVRMLPGPAETLDGLARELLDTALAAPVRQADGNVPADSPRSVH